MENWVISNSKRVREIFDDMVEENPALLDDWKNPAKRNDILERIERELYLESEDGAPNQIEDEKELVV